MRIKMIISFIISLMFMGLFIWGLSNWSYIYMLFTAIISAAFLYNAMRLLGKLHPSKEKQIIKAFLWMTFLFYLFFLFQLTFNVLRGDSVLIFSNKDLMDAYLCNRTNFIPFKSIIEPFKDGYPFSYIIVNIFGNIAALAPMGFFLPMLFRGARKLLPFTIIVALVVVFIEFTQFLFTVGSVDIDDLILNAAGAVIVFLILKIPLVKNLIAKLFPISEQ
ncbi:MAG: VanZ family protein [Clostridia bacterium]|nr:VanZ family protein [Clostridia bacterium]